MMVAAISCNRCETLELDLLAERSRADGLLAQLAAVAPGTCARCALLAAELAEALRQLADALGREADLLASLRVWNRAAAASLDERPEVRQ